MQKAEFYGYKRILILTHGRFVGLHAGHTVGGDGLNPYSDRSYLPTFVQGVLERSPLLADTAVW